MKPAKFREELKKIMPGYNWTVHKSYYPESHIKATGTISSGLNRMSTLRVIRTKKKDIQYTVKSSGFGTQAQWLEENKDKTLVRALRGLQNRYEVMGNNYMRHAADLQGGRKK